MKKFSTKQTVKDDDEKGLTETDCCQTGHTVDEKVFDEMSCRRPDNDGNA